jgi:hypothetical protein
MKKMVLILCVFGVLLSAWAADAPTPPKRAGKVIALTGKAIIEHPDGSRSDAKVGDELSAGSILKTEKNSSVNLFFRRIGTIVQVEPNTTLSLDKLDAQYKDGKLIKRTEISLKEGKFYACVRVLIPESKVLVRTSHTTFHVPGTGMGRFEFNADGSALVGRRSNLTLVATSGLESVSVSPGQFFDPKQTNAVAAAPARFQAFTMNMDALQDTARSLTPPPLPEDMPN